MIMKKRQSKHYKLMQMNSFTAEDQRLLKVPKMISMELSTHNSETFRLNNLLGDYSFMASVFERYRSYVESHNTKDNLWSAVLYTLKL